MQLSVNDTCVYFFPCHKGFPQNNATLLNKLPFSLHGWWPTTFKTRLIAKPFTEFTQEYEPSPYFLDSTTGSHEVGCGHYREYVKHGAWSGYSFEEWKDGIDYCVKWMNDNNPAAPHQCRYSKGYNYVLTVSNIPALKQVGCKTDSQYKNCDKGPIDRIRYRHCAHKNCKQEEEGQYPISN